MGISVKFWGVRGSIPSPLTPEQVRMKVKEALRLAKEGLPIPFEVEATYGGNTTCVEVNVGDHLFILDMGTGVRELGKAQMKKLLSQKTKENRPQLSGTIFQSHVHWDHIQGFPFWAPMYLSQRAFECDFTFFGGKGWEKQLLEVYRGQMSPPEFPVPLQEIEAANIKLKLGTVHDEWMKYFASGAPHEHADIQVLARKLFHPQDTFGYRIAHEGKTIAFTTDHEPYKAGIPRGLLELVQGVDVWITDCQYSHDEYIGAKGPQKMGWGHSFPEYIAEVAIEGKPKKIITTHHDPDSSDERILSLSRQVQDECKIETIPAFEGLSLET